MTLLVVVISVSAPTLSAFFRGRAVDAEARRFLSLTRLGQSRAATEGVPMILWVDAAQRAYGLEEDSSYTTDDSKALEYKLDDNVTVEIGASEIARTAMTADTLFGSSQSVSKHATLPQIRFLPEGVVEETSRENFRFLDRDQNALWVVLSSNRFNYEVRYEIGGRPAPGR
jgi:hypothetical protein